MDWALNTIPFFFGISQDPLLEQIQKIWHYLKSTDHGVALWRNQVNRQAGQMGNATSISSSVSDHPDFG